MNAELDQTDRSWFRTAAGLRFGVEIAVIVLAKLLVLVLLYFIFVAPQPRADTSPAAMRGHVLPGASGEATAKSATP